MAGGVHSLRGPRSLDILSINTSSNICFLLTALCDASLRNVLPSGKLAFRHLPRLVSWA